MTYNGTNFAASLNQDQGLITFVRDVPTTGTILIGHDPGDFAISMAITVVDSNPGSESATGFGDFTLTDADSDTITGNVAGEWEMTEGIPTFAGALTDVYWNDESNDDNFQGDLGWPLGDPDVVSMLFSAPQPWSGTFVELTSSRAAWFGDGDWSGTVTGGSVDALVIPVPAAVLLGSRGLGVAGVKLRKSV
jgi:hypothetical protein